MIRFMKRSSPNRKPGPPPSFGHLESTVMEILWAQGESSVHDVIERLRRPLAYTTVMTTLDRLFKKGFLESAEARTSVPVRSTPFPVGMGANARR